MFLIEKTPDKYQHDYTLNTIPDRVDFKLWKHAKLNIKTYHDFHPKFKFDENFILMSSNCDKATTTKFCTCHDSCAVMPCAKYCGDHILWN